MPPRRTQESCKAWLGYARVSDRTMVDPSTTHPACGRFRNSWRYRESIMDPAHDSTSAAVKPRRDTGSSWRKGLNVENLPSLASRGKTILLTFPFIEPRECISKKMQLQGVLTIHMRDFLIMVAVWRVSNDQSYLTSSASPVLCSVIWNFRNSWTAFTASALALLITTCPPFSIAS